MISMEEEDISLQCMLEQGITLHRTPELIEESCAEHAGQLRRFFLRSGIFFHPLFLIKFLAPTAFSLLVSEEEEEEEEGTFSIFWKFVTCKNLAKLFTFFMKIVFALGFRLRLL